MTVKELLDSFLFDEIAPYITKRYERCEDAEYEGRLKMQVGAS